MGLLQDTKVLATRVQAFATQIDNLKREKAALNGQFFRQLKDINNSWRELDEDAGEVTAILHKVTSEDNLTPAQAQVLTRYGEVVNGLQAQLTGLAEAGGDSFEVLHQLDIALKNLNPQPANIRVNVAAEVVAPSAPQPDFGAWQQAPQYPAPTYPQPPAYYAPYPGAQYPAAPYPAQPAPRPAAQQQIHIHVDNVVAAQQVVPPVVAPVAPAPVAAPAPVYVSATDKARLAAAAIKAQQEELKAQRELEAQTSRAKFESLATAGLQLNAAKIAANRQEIEDAKKTLVAFKKEFHETIALYMLQDAADRASIEGNKALNGATKKAALASIPQYTEFADGLRYYNTFQPERDENGMETDDIRQNSQVLWRTTFEQGYQAALETLRKYGLSGSDVTRNAEKNVPLSLADYPWAQKKT